MNRYEAALAACKLRLRPIVMTSFAFVIGVVPLVIAEGAGAEMRHALGTAVFAGMLGVTLFGIFLTPVFFVAVRRVTEAWGRRSRGATRRDRNDPLADREPFARHFVLCLLVSCFDLSTLDAA